MVKTIDLKEWKNPWVEALRSGKFEQGTGWLKSCEWDENGDIAQEAHCCLGVLAEVSGLEAPNARCLNFSDGKSQYSVVSGLTAIQQDKLISMNDGDNGHDRHSFEEIADYIEKHL